MCTRACLDFAKASLSSEEIEGRTVLEVGSLNVNGSVRPLVEALRPRTYTGVDLQAGPGVDEICDVSDLASRFGEDTFDLVIATEVLEHVRDWRAAIRQLKRVVKRNGVLLLTTRSSGFPYHGFPQDFWRYELDDMRRIFADFRIDRLENDAGAPGVLMKAHKPGDFTEVDLSQHSLLSIVTGRKTLDISERDLSRFVRRRAWRNIFRAPERAVRRLRNAFRRQD